LQHGQFDEVWGYDLEQRRLVKSAANFGILCAGMYFDLMINSLLYLGLFISIKLFLPYAGFFRHHTSVIPLLSETDFNIVSEEAGMKCSGIEATSISKDVQEVN
jgi:hypothetical protein